MPSSGTSNIVSHRHWEADRCVAIAARATILSVLNQMREPLFSIAHPNGFQKIVLGRDLVTGAELRLHIWEQASQSDIHSHTSSFRSLLIAGEMEEIVFKKGVGPSYKVFSVRSDDLTGTFRFELSGDCLLSESRAIIGTSDASRFISRRTPHQVRTSDKRTVTLAFKFARRDAFSEVFFPAGSALPSALRKAEVCHLVSDALIREALQCIEARYGQ